MRYYVEFYDYEESYPSLEEAVKGCVREMKRRDFYTHIPLYRDRGTQRPSGWVQTNGIRFFYVTFSKGRKTVKRLDDNGNFMHPRQNSLSLKRMYKY